MKIVVLGGRGFVGSAMCDFLRGHDVWTFDSSPGGEFHVQGDICDVGALSAAFEGADAVIHAIGLSPLRKGPLYRVHAQGSSAVVQAAMQCGIRHVTYISALGVPNNSSTEYLRTKALAEIAVKSFTQQTLIVRPSLIFDTANELFSQAQLASRMHLTPQIPSLVQPLYRLDLAKWIADMVSHMHTGTYEVAGPDVMSVSDLFSLVAASMGKKTLTLPSWIVRLAAKVVPKLPTSPFSADLATNLDISSTLHPESGERKLVFSTSVFDWFEGRT